MGEVESGFERDRPVAGPEEIFRPPSSHWRLPSRLSVHVNIKGQLFYLFKSIKSMIQ